MPSSVTCASSTSATIPITLPSRPSPICKAWKRLGIIGAECATEIGWKGVAFLYATIASRPQAFRFFGGTRAVIVGRCRLKGLSHEWGRLDQLFHSGPAPCLTDGTCAKDSDTIAKLQRRGV
jgi:hypothetical protein